MKALSVSFLCLALFVDATNDSFARRPTSTNGADSRSSCKDDPERKSGQLRPADEHQADINRLIALRSHSLDELIALAVQLEAKWWLVDWNQYARIMIYVGSEIGNRGLNDVRVQYQTTYFARTALSHSNRYQWEHQSLLVGWFGQRWSPTDSAWLRERREKTELWLQAWQRLEKETDPTFDINNREQLPAMRVSPPFETGLRAGAPPAAIEDPQLRAKYEAAIAENERKSQRVHQQLPLIAYGPSFKARAERVLIQLYSEPPLRTIELKQYLEIYLRDALARKRIMDAVERNAG